MDTSVVRGEMTTMKSLIIHFTARRRDTRHEPLDDACLIDLCREMSAEEYSIFMYSVSRIVRFNFKSEEIISSERVRSPACATSKEMFIVKISAVINDGFSCNRFDNFYFQHV